MAMKYQLGLIIFFISTSLLAQHAREYRLRGVDDSIGYVVTINEDLINDVVTFSTTKDTIKVFRTRGIENVTLNTETFLEIEFRMRDGSGVKVRRKVLLCVSHNKVHKALDIVSGITSRVTEVYDKLVDSLKLFDETQNYNTTLSIRQLEGNQYKVMVLEDSKVESKYDPSQNMAFKKLHELDFDLNGCFFYNSVKQLSKRYKIYSSRDDKTVEKYVSAAVPCIELYQSLYLLIDNEWCIDNGQDFLSCF